MPSVLQPWTENIPMMQQTVLLTAIRGPDGLPKYHPAKFLLRWYRRCVLLSAMDGQVLTNPAMPNGGSFTGPSLEMEQRLVPALGVVTIDPSTMAWEEGMDRRVGDYLKELDGVPHHFHMHLMHAIEIVGYKHPDLRIANWWQSVYIRMAHDMHLWPETREQMDERLGDSREGWLKRADPATRD